MRSDCDRATITVIWGRYMGGPDYNLANFLRTLAKTRAIECWSLTSSRERLIKTGARLVRHGRYALFQPAGPQARTRSR